MTAILLTLKSRNGKVGPILTNTEKLLHQLASEGRLIEAGFAAWLASDEAALSDGQRRSLRESWFHGAEYVFRMIVENTTDTKGKLRPAADYADLIEMMHAELAAWQAEREAKQ